MATAELGRVVCSMRDINESLHRFSDLVPTNGGLRLPDCADCEYSEYRKYLFHV
jgi:hypothetical protein